MTALGVVEPFGPGENKPLGNRMFAEHLDLQTVICHIDRGGVDRAKRGQTNGLQPDRNTGTSNKYVHVSLEQLFTFPEPCRSSVGNLSGLLPSTRVFALGHRA